MAFQVLLSTVIIKVSKLAVGHGPGVVVASLGPYL